VKGRGNKAGLRLWTATLLLLILGLSAAAEARDWPRPQGPVADYAGVIPPAYRRRIAALATELWQKTGVAVVVATLPSLEGHTIEEVAVRLFERWGIGAKGEDKGVLILVAIKERRLRIEVGYGLEGILTDAQAGLIRDRFLVPLLKRNQYGPALLNGVAAVAQLIAARTGTRLTGLPRRRAARGYSGVGLGGLLVLLILGFFFLRGRRGGGGGLLALMLMGSMMGPGPRGGGFGSFGGGFGGFGGGMSGGGGASGGF